MGTCLKIAKNKMKHFCTIWPYKNNEFEICWEFICWKKEMHIPLCGTDVGRSIAEVTDNILAIGVVYMKLTRPIYLSWVCFNKSSSRFQLRLGCYSRPSETEINHSRWTTDNRLYSYDCTHAMHISVNLKQWVPDRQCQTGISTCSTTSLVEFSSLGYEKKGCIVSTWLSE